MESNDWQMHREIIELWFLKTYQTISDALLHARLSEAKSLSLGMTAHLKDQIKEIDRVCK